MPRIQAYAQNYKSIIYKVRLVKTIYTPVEIEAKTQLEAMNKALTIMSETDLDHGECKYTVDFTPDSNEV